MLKGDASRTKLLMTVVQASAQERRRFARSDVQRLSALSGSMAASLDYALGTAVRRPLSAEMGI